MLEGEVSTMESEAGMMGAGMDIQSAGEVEFGSIDLLEMPRLPSWGQMLDHLTGVTPVQPTPSQRRSRKISFETLDDKDD